MSLVRAGWGWLADEPRERVGLRIMQILLAATLLFKVTVYWPLADALWGPHGVAAGQSFAALFGPGAGGVLDRIFQTSAGAHVVLVAIGLGALGLVAGREFYLSVGLALAGFSLLYWRLPFAQGDDDLARFALAYMLLTLPPGVRVRSGALRVWFHNVGVLAIAAQVAILYFIAGFAKAFGEQWQHGTALYYGSQSELFSSPLLHHLVQFPWIVATGTFISVIYPILFPVAILSPFRVSWLVWGMLFHFLTAVLMGLWAFGGLMIGMDLFLITDGEYATLRRWIGARVRGVARAPVARLYIDGFCPTCRATARALARLDWRGRLEIVSFRDPATALPAGLTLPDLETEMKLADLRTGTVAGGFDAVRALAGHLPLLWPSRPLLAAIAWSGWGNRAYRYLAENRKIIPDPRACHLGDAECAVPGDERSANV
ncbi:MAG TPA: DCC1-like thiol-disulfide oxidoreductase family protein [bacterium]|nr:DCC1-like thiol-disulfide oxidoreductase family protein [bacterium]